MTRAAICEKRRRSADVRDTRISGPKIHVVRTDRPKRGAVRAALKISGNQTTLGMLLDRAVERLDEILLKDRKGGDWSEWPEDLRVREFPV